MSEQDYKQFQCNNLGIEPLIKIINYLKVENNVVSHYWADITQPSRYDRAEIAVKDVTDVRVIQSWKDKLLNIGIIEVDENNSLKITVKKIKDPYKFKNLITELQRPKPNPIVLRNDFEDHLILVPPLHEIFWNTINRTPGAPGLQAWKQHIKDGQHVKAGDNVMGITLLGKNEFREPSIKSPVAGRICHGFPVLEEGHPYRASFFIQPYKGEKIHTSFSDLFAEVAQVYEQNWDNTLKRLTQHGANKNIRNEPSYSISAVKEALAETSTQKLTMISTNTNHWEIKQIVDWMDQCAP